MLVVERNSQVPGMGACLGLCRKKQKSRKIGVPKCFYNTKSDQIEMEVLVDNEMITWEEVTDNYVWTTAERLPALLPSEKGKEAYEVEDFKRSYSDLKRCDDLKRQSNLYLDAHALLASRAVRPVTASLGSSTPPSSLELEWENEDSFVPATSHKTKSLPSLSQGQSSGCEGDSPESLEWDPCDDNTTDLETEQLLIEIEVLTKRALQETGSWTEMQ